MAATKPKVTPEIKIAIIEAAGLMLSIGADWPTIRTELYRQTTNPNFDRWDLRHLPSQSTLERWMKIEAGATTVAQLKQKRLNTVKTRLKRKALTMALNGDRTMLIFSLKNLCGWSDNPISDDDDPKGSGMTDAERKEALKRHREIADEEG